jgi:hypothetical protein
MSFLGYETSLIMTNQALISNKFIIMVEKSLWLSTDSSHI